MVNRTRPTNALYLHYLYLLTAGNYKSASGKLEDNFLNGAMLITINCVITVGKYEKCIKESSGSFCLLLTFK